MWYIDPISLLIAIPGLILAGIASFLTKVTFDKYSKVRSSNGLTGAEAAARLLAGAGIRDVKIERIGGFLSDHYDPTQKVLRLSPNVYDSCSLSAIGVACHEAGHALQHAAFYAPMHVRSLLVPAAQISSPLSYLIIMAGFLMQSQQMILVGAIFFGATVLFSLITLPVEWDASSRAKKLMVSCGVVSQAESQAAGRVLNAAFLTYLAAAINALLWLLYYLMRAGVFGGRRD